MELSEYYERRYASLPRAVLTEIESYFDRLWPIMRSITGQGVRQTHDILGELLPLERMEFPSGQPVFDWTVPDEWKFVSGFLQGPGGEVILDSAVNNLHVLNYSEGFYGEVSLEELQDHLYSLPSLPDAIPYVTSYYERRWGFCLSHRQRESLKPGTYTVHIDADHFPGSLTLSHALLPGEVEKEILISSYTCHPSMANNELSGPLVLAFLYRLLAAMPRRHYTYRFVLCPETIGAIAYLSRFGEELKTNVAAGLILSCIGDEGSFTYKKSRDGGTLIDRASTYVLTSSGTKSDILDYWPGGSDERQYCSPGFNLPVGLMARSIYGRYEEYHTSLDDKDFISFDSLRESIEICFSVIALLENNRVYERTQPHCEPFLSKYNLYETLGASKDTDERKRALQWLLNLADGEHDLLSIAQRSQGDFWLLADLAEALLSADILQER